MRHVMNDVHAAMESQKQKHSGDRWTRRKDILINDFICVHISRMMTKVDSVCLILIYCTKLIRNIWFSFLKD